MQSAPPVQVLLGSLSRRLAVAAGALAGLVSLFHDAPVRIACLRGAVAFAAGLLIARLARGALRRSLEHDRAARGGAA